MASKPAKKAEAKTLTVEPVQPEASVPPTEEINQTVKPGTEEAENSSDSSIASKALPSYIEPHVYKPETPTATAETEPPETIESTQPTEATPKTTTPQAPAEQNPSVLEEDNITANEPLFEPEEKSNKKLFVILAIVLVIVGAATFWFFTNKNKGAEDQKPQTSQSQQITDTTTEEIKSEEATFDRSKITLEVLNGSGVAGAAKKIADSLSALEYQIIEVGNAQEDSESSQILISKDLEPFQEEFLKDLEGIINEASVSGELKNSTASARITIGINN